jgi:hypothetical protein
MKLQTSVAAACVCLLQSQLAFAEVPLGKVGEWETFTRGRVGAFASYIAGDGYPVAPIDPATGMPIARNILPGGGLPTLADRIPETDGNGDPIPGRAGTVSKWRIHSGYYPNIFGFGVRSQVAEELKLTGFVAVWGTIETEGQRKYYTVQADFREANLVAAGTWGSVTAGRMLSLYSRGITEIDQRYGHGYGVGYTASLGSDTGPTAGMVGFGVLAASYNAGFYYTTPSLGGLAINLGVFDPVIFSTSWNRTNTPRPETEITYDFENEAFLTHVFVNGAFQRLYKENNAKDSETMYGVGGGVRLEFGPFHLGGGGHYGKGLGMWRAFDGDGAPGATNVGPTSNLDPVTMQEVGDPSELRTFDGYSVFGQYSHEKFDINLAFGQSRAHLLAIDKLIPTDSLIKTQTGISAGFVYHVSKNLHVDVDYLRAMFRWYQGDKQDVNFINAGATIDW